jgi:thiol-disulfide isomerase/thioredoxin
MGSLLKQTTQLRLRVALCAVSLCPAVLLGCSRGSSQNAEPPVSSSLPNTTFPMPPINSASVRELGWVLPSPPQADERSIKRQTIGAYQGKVLVLDFYATWCVPCRQSIPHLNELQRKYQHNGLEIVGLNVGGSDDRVKVRGFAKELDISYALGFPDQELVNVLLADNITIPQTFVFDRQGMLVKRFIGYEKSTGVEIEQLIDTEIKKSPQ